MRRLLAGGALLALVAGACGSTPAVAGRAISLEMSEFAFHPKEIRVRSGELVTFVLKNKGNEPHEVMAGRGAIQHSGGYTEDLFSGVDVQVRGNTKPDHTHDSGFMVVAGKGATAYLTFTVPPRLGTYELGCFQPGHYAAGMIGKLVIEQP